MDAYTQEFIARFVAVQTSVGGTDYDTELARHLADSMTAQEKNQRAARYDGDLDLLEGATQQIMRLRKVASDLGFSQEEYPGLYRCG